MAIEEPNEQAPSPELPSPPDANGTEPTESTHSFRQLLQQKWPEYLLEIAVIIFSISVSFALDRWQEESSNNKLEHRYLHSLHDDIQSDIKNLQSIIAETEGVIKAAQELLKLGEQLDSTELDYKQFSAHLREVVKRPRYYVKDATFTDLTSSANMRLIKDFDLKNALFEYYQQYKAIQMVEASEQEIIINITALYLVKHFSLEGIIASDSTLAVTPPATISTAILKDTEYRNNILLRLFNRRELLGNYQEALQIGQYIQQKLAAQRNF